MSLGLHPKSDTRGPRQAAPGGYADAITKI
jgi:hypothetical protein